MNTGYRICYHLTHLKYPGNTHHFPAAKGRGDKYVPESVGLAPGNGLGKHFLELAVAGWRLKLFTEIFKCPMQRSPNIDGD